jgi:hypothetical protein
MGLSPAPIITMFPQAPLRSRTVGFPESGSDLGLSFVRLPRSRRGSSAGTRTPRRNWFAHNLVPASKVGYSRLCVRETTLGPPSTQSPFASGRCYRPGGRPDASPRRALHPSSSLLQAHAPILCPPAAYGLSLGRQLFAGCHQPLLDIAPSQRYSLESFP